MQVSFSPRPTIREGWRAAERNTKHQTPSSREVPNFKHQTPKTDAGAQMARRWFFELELGDWNLELVAWAHSFSKFEMRSAAFLMAETSQYDKLRSCSVSDSARYSLPWPLFRSRGLSPSRVIPSRRTRK